MLNFQEFTYNYLYLIVLICFDFQAICQTEAFLRGNDIDTKQFLTFLIILCRLPSDADAGRCI